MLKNRKPEMLTRKAELLKMNPDPSGLKFQHFSISAFQHFGTAR